MRQLSDLSGPWRGWSISGRNRGTVVAELAFGASTILGDGIGPLGRFHLEGQYTGESGRVVFSKHYADRMVIHEAKWDGTLISGRWFYSCLNMSEAGPMADSGSGSFEIWPAAHETPVPPFHVN